MSNSLDFSALGSVAPQAKSIVCFLHPQTTFDAVAAALAFKQAAEEAGKHCSVVCEEPMRVEYNNLIAIDQVESELGNRDLVISFAYSESQVDKVSYNVNEATQRFELVVSPQPGQPALDPSSLEFSRAGLSADIVLLFGYHALQELGVYYEKERQVIDAAYTVAITQSKVPSFAKLHVQLQQDHLSYSELVYYLIRQLRFGEPKDDIATNLVAGIEYATERFQAATTQPRTFETLASLMKQGARRMPNNPAFAHLNTPIREVEQANQNQPMGGHPMPGMPFRPGNQALGTQPLPQQAYGQMGVVPGFSQPGVPMNYATQGGTVVAGQPVSVAPNDFARAMGGRT